MHALEDRSREALYCSIARQSAEGHEYDVDIGGSDISLVPPKGVHERDTYSFFIVGLLDESHDFVCLNLASFRVVNLFDGRQGARFITLS